jgi:hypothetical protein
MGNEHFDGQGDDDYYWDDYDDYEDDESQPHEEWVRLASGIWMILQIFPDGYANVLWAIRQPGDGTIICGL